MRGFLLVGVLLSASALAGAPRAAASRVVLRAGRTEVMLAPGAAVVARASVRDLTADIGTDPYATERVFAALDYERDRRRDKNLVDAALRRLGKKDRAFARAVLHGDSWREMGLAKSTFSDRLKKVEKLLSRL